MFKTRELDSLHQFDSVNLINLNSFSYIEKLVMLNKSYWVQYYFKKINIWS